MAGGQGLALVGVLTVLPTPMLAVNILFTVALFTLPGAMVWLDRQGRMPTALPWTHLLLITPVMAFALLMISFQPNNYCNTVLQHSEFRAFYVLFLPFLPLLAHMVGSDKVGRPWLFGCIITISLLFVFDLTVAYEVLHMVYQTKQEKVSCTQAHAPGNATTLTAHPCRWPSVPNGVPTMPSSF